MKFNIQWVLHSSLDEDNDGAFLKVMQLFSKAIFIEKQEWSH